MSRITQAEAQGWAETTKLPITLDTNLLDQIEEEVIARLRSVYDTSGWTTSATTPRLVRTAIAKLYVSWLYNRVYSEDEGVTNDFAQRLAANSEMIVSGLLDGTIELPAPDVSLISGGGPGFYPTDASSAMAPTTDDPSLGPARFSMGTVF